MATKKKAHLFEILPVHYISIEMVRTGKVGPIIASKFEKFF